MVRTLLATGHDVVAATRRVPEGEVLIALSGAHIISGIDARFNETLAATFAEARPDAVVNAIGIVKQRPAAKEAVESIRINSLLPHELAAMCVDVGAKLVHISTDCVFSGAKGDYTEGDLPDPVDLYGRSKLLGEVVGPGCLTIRTSIIGLELSEGSGLIEWFLRQTGSASGWSRAMYSGVTTAELSRVIVELLSRDDPLNGLWHLSADPISKLDLLVKLRDLLGREIKLVPDDSVTIDRTMNSDRLRSAASYEPPSWDLMLSELATSVREREFRRG